jgi:site-specific DNA recombinase
MPSYFAYCRKSSEAEDRQILSIDSQVTELKRFAAKRGLKIAGILTEAKSAKAPGRPVFNSLMERLYRGEADGVLCWKLDRLARNPVDGGAIIWAMKEREMKIITPFQTYGQAEDNVVWMYLEFGMAQKYVDDLSKNVRRGLRAKAESGWFPGSTPPGYVNRADAEGRNVVAKDPKQFDLVRKCWNLMLTGKYTPAEVRGIANTAWGFKTANGNPLGRSTIYSILSNPFYHGTYEYPKGSNTWHTGRHTPMITEDEFDTVQRLLSRSKHMPKSRKVFAFTGLIRCGGCENGVTAEEKHQLICSQCRFKFAYRSKEICPRCKIPIEEMKNPKKLHYTCYHCARSGNPACPERAIKGEELDRQALEALARVHLPMLHGLWLNRSFARMSRSRDELDTLGAVRESFPAATPEAKRQVVMAVFSKVILKDRKLEMSLKQPFVFSNEAQLPGMLSENTLAQEAMQEQVARP